MDSVNKCSYDLGLVFQLSCSCRAKGMMFLPCGRNEIQVAAFLAFDGIQRAQKVACYEDGQRNKRK